MGLTVDETLSRIDEIHAKKKFWEHPMWKGLLDGSHDLPKVREFARQHGIIPLHNHNYHGRLYVVCPDPKWREMIAEVVYEEGTGELYASGVPHNDLYYNFGEGLGISRDEMWNTDYCAGALGFKAYFSYMCGKNFLEGVAAHMLAGEAQGPGYFGTIAENFKSSFGLDDKGVAFWTVHDVADEDHSGIGRQLLDRFATTEKDLETVLHVVQETVDVMQLMEDDVWSCMRKAS